MAEIDQATTGLESNRRDHFGGRWAVALLSVAACLYLPFTVFLGADPDGVTREEMLLYWLKWTPVLPGFFAGVFFMDHSPTIGWCVMGLGTVALLTGLTRVALWGGMAWVAACVVAALFSMFTASFCAIMFTN